MKKFLLSFVCFLFLTSLVFCQDYNIPFRKGNLWGYAGLDGNIKLEPKYDSVSPYCDNNRWFVFKDKKMGVVNENGYELLKPEYDTIAASPVHSEYHDYYIVKNGKEGFTDMWGTVVLEPIYEAVTVCWEKPDSNYTFFVKENGEWSMMDASKKIYLQHIEKYEDEYDGLYKLKIKGKWGICDAEKKQMLVDAEYDSIGRLDSYKDFYRLKKEYSLLKYFAKKGKDLFLINKYFETKASDKTIDELLVNEGGESEVFAKVESGDNEPQFKNILSFETANTPIMGGAVKLKYRGWNIREIYLEKENNKLGLTIEYRNSIQSIPAEFDSVKMIAYSSDNINERYALVAKGKKWGIYEIEKSKLAVPAEYSKVYFSKQRELLVLQNGKKQSAYKLQNNYDDLASGIISPFYDNIVKSVYVYPYNKDRYRQPVTLYYYVLNNIVYPVGSNGINYYSDK